MQVRRVDRPQVPIYRALAGVDADLYGVRVQAIYCTRRGMPLWLRLILCS
jgi:hypothetical protein